MGALFTLDVETDAAKRRAVLRLADEQGRHLGASEVEIDRHRPSFWSGLFDTRGHLARMWWAEAGPEEQLAELGVFLGKHVLGAEIARVVAEGVGQRTVLVRPGDPKDDWLAAAFARVPWEIARAPGENETLFAKNVVVRAAPSGMKPGPGVRIERDEAVRVLLVFAEAPEARPLAARLERERLLDLFFGEVMPKKNVEVDVLCHGVTRARLREQVKARGGYHVVHWSGHGHVDSLELALDARETKAKVPALVSGAELVGLLGAGGFVPPVVFLGACQSGALWTAKDWESLRASLREGRREGRSGEVPAVVPEGQVGFTGTALSLVRAGVTQVVAMRYEVGDRYARRLGRRFYRHLLGESAGHSVDEALSLARGELFGDVARKGEYAAVDHVNPLVFGGEVVRFAPKGRRSKQMDRRAPKPQPLLLGGSRELDAPRGFVGRGEELTLLSQGWLGSEGAPIALIQGLAGLGKTALAAEAVHLWFGSFDYVLCFQAKGGALGIEELYRRIDQRLAIVSPAYRERCEQNEMAKVYLDAVGEMKGDFREETLRNNLIDVLAAERILIVLDNFEANLTSDEKALDPAWDRLLAALGDRLRGTGSRVLITSRHKLAALADPEHVLWIPLGPLPIEQARLFFEGHSALRGLWNGGKDDERLARKILDVSRGHPLILARIADLARAYEDKISGLGAAGRDALDDALEKIKGDGYKALPDIFVGAKTKEDKERERAYLEDVACGAVDLLIKRMSPEARLLLWMVTRAAEPVKEGMIAPMGCESSAEQLGELCNAGLLVREGDAYSFHELVAERATDWMEKHPEELGGNTEAEVWTAYGVWYGETFHELIAATKRDQASEVGRRGIRYLVRARAFDRLGAFAGGVVIGTSDPALLEQVIADLQDAAADTLKSELRWQVWTYLANALRMAGRPNQALSFYEQAAEEAQTAQDWASLGAICNNWAGALAMVGQLNRARETFLRSADAKQRAGSPRINIVMSELEALRVDVMQGRPEHVLSAIETKLGEVRGLWTNHHEGRDREDLARAMIASLNIATQANHVLENWQACLDLIGELEQVDRAIGAGEHELARTRFNRSPPLLNLGKLAEAKTVLEDCLDVFLRVGDVAREAATLSALANVWNVHGDPDQAISYERRALAMFERRSDPGARAVSHNNLALYLHNADATDEAKTHQLAALIYRIITGLDLRNNLNTLTDRIREAASRGETFTLPRLEDLLATPAFAPLRAFLAERNASIPDLQTTIDKLVVERS